MSWFPESWGEVQASSELSNSALLRVQVRAEAGLSCCPEAVVRTDLPHACFSTACVSARGSSTHLQFPTPRCEHPCGLLFFSPLYQHCLLTLRSPFSPCRPLLCFSLLPTPSLLPLSLHPIHQQTLSTPPSKYSGSGPFSSPPALLLPRHGLILEVQSCHSSAQNPPAASHSLRRKPKSSL